MDMQGDKLVAGGDTVTETKPAGRPRKRSPSYPAINLEQAIKRAGEIWTREQDYAAPLSAVFSLWGYKAGAGNANLAVAALRKFGLVEYEGIGDARKVKLTPLAVQILNHPDPDRRSQAVKQAALRPEIHRELWEKYQGRLPSDDTLRWELERERDFSRSGAAEFIPEYRQTIAFARLSESDSVEPQTPESEDENVDQDGAGDGGSVGDGGKRPRKLVGGMSHSGVLTIPVPVIGGSPITVEGIFPVTEAAWEQFLAVLNAMKPGLVRSEDTDELEEGNTQ